MKIRSYSEIQQRAMYLVKNIKTISKDEWAEMNECLSMLNKLDTAIGHLHRAIGNYCHI